MGWRLGGKGRERTQSGSRLSIPHRGARISRLDGFLRQRVRDDQTGLHRAREEDRPVSDLDRRLQETQSRHHRGTARGSTQALASPIPGRATRARDVVSARVVRVCRTDVRDHVQARAHVRSPEPGRCARRAGCTVRATRCAIRLARDPHRAPSGSGRRGILPAADGDESPGPARRDTARGRARSAQAVPSVACRTLSRRAHTCGAALGDGRCLGRDHRRGEPRRGAPHRESSSTCRWRFSVGSLSTTSSQKGLARSIISSSRIGCGSTMPRPKAPIRRSSIRSTTGTSALSEAIARSRISRREWRFIVI